MFESFVFWVVVMSISYFFLLINWGYILSLKVICYYINRYFFVICFFDMCRYKMIICVNSFF